MKLMHIHACLLLALGASHALARQAPAATPADPSTQASPVSYSSPLPAPLSAATTTPDQAWKAANRVVAEQASSGHGNHTMPDHSQHGAPIDHSKMDHSPHSAPVDHSKMDHSQHSAPVDHSKMDHSQHGAPVDHSKMDHSKMGHGQQGMDHSQHTGHKEGK